MAKDDSGYVMEIECPYGTQAMADALLESLAGNTYRGYRADAAELDSEAELGDGVTLGDVYSMLAYRSVGFGPGHMSGIAAPCENELEHEYPYKSQAERQIERKIATTRSMITKTSEEIRLEVSKELNGLSSSIDLKLGGITSTVKGIGERVTAVEQTASGLTTTVKGLGDSISTLDQKVDSFTLSVSNGTSSSTIKLMAGTTQVSSQTIQFTGDVVFASDLTDGKTTISGDNILTGEISAEYLKLGGTMNVYSSLTDTSAAGSLGYVVGSIKGNPFTGIGMVATEDTAVLASAKDDVLILSVDDTGIVAGKNINLNASSHVRIDSNYLIPLADETTYCGSYSYWWLDGYFKSLHVDGSAITSSDRRLKENIDYDISKWLTMFDLLKPCSYKFIEGKRTHVGMIAQEVIEAGETAGLDMEHLTAVCLDEEGQMYGLRYEEFVPILIAKVQQLEKRLEALSA